MESLNSTSIFEQTPETTPAASIPASSSSLEPDSFLNLIRYFMISGESIIHIVTLAISSLNLMYLLVHICDCPLLYQCCNKWTILEINYAQYCHGICSANSELCRMCCNQFQQQQQQQPQLDAAQSQQLSVLFQQQQIALSALQQQQQLDYGGGVVGFINRQ
uniref:ShKT domain-containing protein n=1 Tax=Globodera pallida TaxID=36090 RepID=A0A183C3X6_GLOPA